MAKSNDTGLFQLPNGNWAYRITVKQENGKKKDTTCRKDENGNPFKTKKQAKDARELRVVALKEEAKGNAVGGINRYTLTQVWEQYLKTEAIGKAHATIVKQKSMWNNHIKDRFGDKIVNDITKAELKGYLNLLYTYGDGYSEQSYAYDYVEGFLKFFYLLFGQAFGMNAITYERYHSMFSVRNTRLTMPEKKQVDDEEDDDIMVYNQIEILQMEKVFKRGNCYLPFLIGYYCGLRISEVFGLSTLDYDRVNKTLTVDKQLLYQDGVWCLCPVKTLESRRTILVPNFLGELIEKQIDYVTSRKFDGDFASRSNEIIYDRRVSEDGPKIVGFNFLNRKDNGELLTPNSIKYWAECVKNELNIDFKFHSLRKTHATMLANLNTPVYELKARLGHKKISTTMKYYVNNNQKPSDILIANLNSLDLSGKKLV